LGVPGRTENRDAKNRDKFWLRVGEEGGVAERGGNLTPSKKGEKKDGDMFSLTEGGSHYYKKKVH